MVRKACILLAILLVSAPASAPAQQAKARASAIFSSANDNFSRGNYKAAQDK